MTFRSNRPLPMLMPMPQPRAKHFFLLIIYTVTSLTHFFQRWMFSIKITSHIFMPRKKKVEAYKKTSRYIRAKKANQLNCHCEIHGNIRNQPLLGAHRWMCDKFERVNNVSRQHIYTPNGARVQCASLMFLFNTYNECAPFCTNVSARTHAHTLIHIMSTMRIHLNLI